jgi:hypothetical protein
MLEHVCYQLFILGMQSNSDRQDRKPISGSISVRSNWLPWQNVQGLAGLFCKRKLTLVSIFLLSEFDCMALSIAWYHCIDRNVCHVYFFT